MPDFPKTTFPLHVSVPGGDDLGDLVDVLRTELLDAGASTVEVAPGGPVPAGARGAMSNISDGLQLLVTTGAAGEVVARIVRAVQHWRNRLEAERSGRRPTVEIDGVELGEGEEAARALAELLAAASRTRRPS